MTNPPAAPPPQTVPWRRAAAAAAKGFAIDVAAGVVLAVAPSLADAHFAWTRTYWISVGLLAAKTAVQTAGAYLASRAAASRR